MHSLYYKNSKQQIKTIKVEPLDDYCLRVYFSNGEIKIFDVKPYLEYKMFLPLKDKKFFSTVKVYFNTAAWDYKRKEPYADGIDIDPHELYWDSVSEHCPSK